MLISLNWIADFVTIKKTPQEIADKITLSLSEVEKITKIGNDSVLEIENKALTHRPDCFSQLGIAREIAAFYNLKLKPLLQEKKSLLKITGESLPLTIKVISPDLCPRYSAIVIRDIKIEKSPEFIVKRLISCGVRPINNVVDITNYVMLEMGQPLHAFDYEKIEKHTIIVRKARKGEIIRTLDEVKRSLTETNLVIADSSKPIALGGIMGGADSEVTAETKTIALESANFNAKSVRVSAKKLALRTEAVTRFEKNLDPNLTRKALLRAIALLEKYANGKVASKIEDFYPHQYKPPQIITSANYINNLLGLKLTEKEIATLLLRLGIKSEIKNGKLVSTPPSERRDLTMGADIAEEVARIYGYDNIPTTLPQGVIKPPPTNLSLAWEKKVKIFFRGLGFTEINLSSFISEKLLNLLNEDSRSYLKLINPTTPEKEYLRQSLLPAMIEEAANNLRYFKKFSLFQIGRTFFPLSKNKQPKEIKMLSVILIGKDYYEAKGYLEVLFDFLNIPFPKLKKIEKNPFLVQNGGAQLGNWGCFGLVNTSILKFLGTTEKVTVLELNFDLLVEAAKTVKAYQPIALYPPLVEDYSFEFTKIPPLGEVLTEIKNIDKNINSTSLLDQYQSTLTFRVVFQNPKKPLSGKEILPLRKKLIKIIGQKYQGKIKGRI